MNLFDIGRVLNETQKEPEIAVEFGRKFPIAYRDTETDPVVCPYCYREHQHGTADGSRATHCSSKDHNKKLHIDESLFTPTDGYVVVTRWRRKK